MILVLLGTQKHQFTRLLQAIEKDLASGQIHETVIVQNGHTLFQSERMALIGFIGESTLDELVQKAEIIISHGGAGSIFKSLGSGKIVICAARLSLLGEHFNDHQIEIVQRLSALGYLLDAGDPLNIASSIQAARSFTPKPFVSNTDFFVRKIRSFIDEQA